MTYTAAPAVTTSTTAAQALTQHKAQLEAAFSRVAKIGSDGKLQNVANILPTATTTSIGAVKVGSGLSVAPDGTLSSNAVGTAIYANIAARDAAGTVSEGTLCHVQDASGDSTVSTTNGIDGSINKWAEYIYAKPAGSNTLSWIKTAEQESVEANQIASTLIVGLDAISTALAAI